MALCKRLNQKSMVGSIAIRAIAIRQRGAEKISRLYEQGAATDRIRDYVLRWDRWVRAGLAGVGLDFESTMWDGFFHAEYGRGSKHTSGEFSSMCESIPYPGGFGMVRS